MVIYKELVWYWPLGIWTEVMEGSQAGKGLRGNHLRKKEQ